MILGDWENGERGWLMEGHGVAPFHLPKISSSFQVPSFDIISLFLLYSLSPPSIPTLFTSKSLSHISLSIVPSFTRLSSPESTHTHPHPSRPLNPSHPTAWRLGTSSRNATSAHRPLCPRSSRIGSTPVAPGRISRSARANVSSSAAASAHLNSRRMRQQRTLRSGWRK
ncbi:hypothetical protein EJ06DRAFT_275482 [Trichodelitschia bisporula]|uniref:Uncharacterized protein n=1 Tax=Trichodelitschia bisporula TaxID=703511 RepID=A0A6G1I502_9PEZI|nr:hypothetical protein EJ06DRAFT_275482 [Trichodelitschia bisporula]